jgi:hypothetical protein
MATGANIQPRRDNGVTANVPSIDLDDGAADMWRSVGRLADQIGQGQTANLRRIAERRGAEEGAAVAAGELEPPRRGLMEALLSGSEVYQARQAAFQQAYMAGTQTDFDGQEAEVRRRNVANPQGYEREMQALRSGFIQGADPEYAVDVEAYANRRIQAGLASVADAAQSVALREATTEVATRQNLLATRLTDLIRDGQEATVEFEFLRDEREQLIQQRLANPAIPYSQAEADEDEREFITASKAALYTRDAVATLRSEGPDAAIATLQEILTDPDIAASERSAVFESARAAVNQEIDLASDRANLANAARSRREQEMQRRIEDDAAAIEIGLPGTGLTEAEVLAISGPSGVAEWRRKQAEASERNRLTGDLIGLPRDEAIARARQALAGAEGTVADLSEPLNTPADFDALVAAVRTVETGNNPARISEAGAVGAMQLLPDTARAMARLEGVPYDENRLLNDTAYNERLGRRYLTTLLDQYGGNQMLAVAAYHAGPGLVDAWLKPRGVLTPVRLGNRTVQAAGRGDPRTGEITTTDWLDSIADGNPRSAAYPRRVAEALTGGRQSAEWLQTQAEALVTNATAGFASDPLNFAAQHRIAALPPLPVDGVFVGGEQGQAWAEGLRGRQALGGNLADQRGAPLRYLTNGEVATYKDRIERNPADAITLARAATQAIGARGARDLLAEIGQNSEASTAIHIGDLSVSGDNRFADQAAHGMTLRAAGQTLPTETRDEINAALRPHRISLRNSPSLMTAVTNTAQAAALADDAAGRTRPAAYYAQAALGRTTYQGREYGGSAPVNGVNVVVPRWLNPDYFDDALEAMADDWTRNRIAPVYSNGETMSAREVGRLRPVLMPNGNYRLVDARGRVAYGPNRRVFEVDMEAGRDFIARRLGATAVRPD